MPDSPDYNKYLPGSTRFSLQDMGELAARLGSPVTYDRRGEIIWYDDFRHGISGFQTITVGSGAAIVLSCDTIYRSPYSAKLTPGTTLNKQATLWKLLGTIELDRGGLEVAFSLPLNFDYANFLVVYYRGNERWAAEIRINKTDGVISAFNDTSSYTTITTLSSVLQVTSGINFIKFVWDFSDNTYKRLMINGFTYDISNISLNKFIGSVQANMLVGVGIYSTGDASQSMYLHHIILSSNEP